MAEDMGERTEQPTERKLSTAREEGQIAKSADLSAAIVLLGVVLLVWYFGTGMVREMTALMRQVLAGEVPGGLLSESGAIPAFVLATVQGALSVWPIIVLLMLIVYLAHYHQVGFLITTKPLQPNFGRTNPIKGLKRLVEKKNLIKSGVSVLKLVAISAIAGMVIANQLRAVAALPNLGALDAMAQMAHLIFRVAMWVVVVLIIIGVVDWMVQKWQHKQDLRMTKQEVKDERRSMEGDEIIKGRRMRIAREMANQRMKSAVPKAKVIVTNPTHFSVAIAYEGDTMSAPKVVAKGADWLAFQIRQVAVANGVPIVEKPELARALYASVPVGREIQPQFYQAVAELLAFVYRLEGKADEAKQQVESVLRDRDEDLISVN